MLKRSFHKILATWFLMIPTFANVQASSVDLTKMTLSELIEFGEKNNPSLASSKQAVRVAEGELQSAGLFPNPVFTYSQSFIGGKPGSEAGSTEYAPGLSYEFDFFGKRSQKKTVAENSLNAEKSSFENIRRLYRLQFKSEYRRYFLLKTQVQYKSDFYKSYLTVLDACKVRVEKGDLSGVDYGRLELERIAFEGDFYATQIQLNEVSQNLRRLLGLPISEDPLELRGDLEFKTLKELGLDLGSKILKKRADLTTLENISEKYSSELTLKYREILPNINLGSEYRMKGMESYFGFSLSFPLPVFNRNQGQISILEELKVKTLLETKAKELEIQSEIQTKVTELKLREKLLETYRAMNLIEKNREVAERSRFAYLRKAYSIIELLESQRNYVNVLKNYYEQVLRYYQAFDEYQSASGAEGDLNV